MATMTTYHIEYYPADGCSYDRARDLRPLDGRYYDSIAAARAAIHARIGDYGSYRDPDGNENWYENDRDGCGGYSIVRDDHEWVARIDARAISAYVDSRLAQRAAPASVNRELAALSAMLRLGRELRLLTQDGLQPLKIRMLPEDKVREGFVDDAQFARIVDSLQADELRDLARFLYITIDNIDIYI